MYFRAKVKRWLNFFFFSCDNNFLPYGLIKFSNIPKASSATMTYDNVVLSELLIGLGSEIFNVFFVSFEY